jgi:glycosyltransferase involved in cell wall biosynthesis
MDPDGMSQGGPWRASLAERAEVGKAAGITRYLHWVWEGREDLRRAYPDLDGADGPRFVEWAHLFGRHEVPIPDDLLPPRPAHLPEAPRRLVVPAAAPGGWGVNVAGHLRGELGLGEAARMLVAAVDAAGIPVLPVDIGAAGSFRSGHRFLATDPGPLPYPATIVCANPDSLWTLARRLGPELFEERHTIGLWWWEALGGPPVEWVGPASLVDEVWAGSRFVAETVEAIAPGPVPTVTLPVSVPPTGPPDRRRFGLPDGFVFLYAFDYNSTLTRKNPAALVEAFRSAFPPGSGATLVLKSIGGHVQREALARVEALAHGHPDVITMDGWLDGRERHALMACCDCYVSLHRSEGFGLTLAEAMYLGKPVIATGFGGNLDFMTTANSYLVGWQPIRVGEGAFPYPPDGTWADPDVEHAAGLMRAVFNDPAAAAQRGRRGALDIRRSHSFEAAAESVRRLLAPVRAATYRAGRARSGDAAEAAAAVQAAPPSARERAASLLEAGPERAFVRRQGPLRRLVRRVLLRLLRPFAAYEQALDRELVEALREAEVAVRDAERRSLERHAAVLGELRRAADRAEGRPPLVEPMPGVLRGSAPLPEPELEDRSAA